MLGASGAHGSRTLPSSCGSRPVLRLATAEFRLCRSCAHGEFFGMPFYLSRSVHRLSKLGAGTIPGTVAAARLWCKSKTIRLAPIRNDRVSETQDRESTLSRSLRSWPGNVRNSAADNPSSLMNSYPRDARTPRNAFDLLGTHEHRDHTGRNEAMVRKTRAKILAHKNASDKIADGARGLGAGGSLGAERTLSIHAPELL